MKARESIITIFVLDCSVNKARNYSGQSYKQLTLVNYDSRVVPDLKNLHITTLGS